MPAPFNGEKAVFSTNYARISTCKRMKLDLSNAFTKINSKWKDLNVRPKRKKFLEENIAQKLHDTGFGNNSLHITPKA